MTEDELETLLDLLDKAMKAKLIYAGNEATKKDELVLSSDPPQHPSKRNVLLSVVRTMMWRVESMTNEELLARHQSQEATPERVTQARDLMRDYVERLQPWKARR